MGDTWGDEGPPREAYSRVSRDLETVTAGFRDHLDRLPAVLSAAHDCRVRDLRDDERRRLPDDVTWTHTYAVEPADPDAATLLVGRHTSGGAASVWLAFGTAAATSLPGCTCDACDEDSESLVGQAEEFVRAAVGGCREFRRPYRPVPGEPLEGGPWLQEGYATDRGTTSHASHEVTGDLFSREWRPWPPREGG